MKLTKDDIVWIQEEEPMIPLYRLREIIEFMEDDSIELFNDENNRKFIVAWLRHHFTEVLREKVIACQGLPESMKVKE